MRQRDLRLYLYDIIRSANLLSRFTSGKTLVDYRTDALLRSAVERPRETEHGGPVLRRSKA